MILLAAVHDSFMRQWVAALDRTARERKLLGEVREELCRAASEPNWEALARVTGKSLSCGAMVFAGSSTTSVKSIHSEVIRSRLNLYPNLTDAVIHFNEKDPLHWAEQYFRQVITGQTPMGRDQPADRHVLLSGLSCFHDGCG